MFFPCLLIFGHRLGDIDIASAIALANIHLVFNLATGFIFTLFITLFTHLVDCVLVEGEMDFERLKLPAFAEEDNFDQVRSKLENGSEGLFIFVQENDSTVTSQTLVFFDDTQMALCDELAVDLKKTARAFQHNIDSANRDLLILMVDPCHHLHSGFKRQTHHLY
ncbi:MAG: hypothetical protein ACI9C4_000336 [Paraglaciecola sp.]